MKLPDKVRAGEKLSARWLNQVIDCLASLDKKCGSDRYSTASISYASGMNHISKYREMGDSAMPVFVEYGFELRLKPKHLCDETEDGYPKILQVRRGYISDYSGHSYLVPYVEQAGSSDGSSAGSVENAEWIDLATFSTTPTNVYCVIKQSEYGKVEYADFALDEQAYTPWGAGSSDNLSDGSGLMSVLIGTGYMEKVEEQNHFYICQQHQGAIELQMVQVDSKQHREDSSSGLNIFLERRDNLFVFKMLQPGKGIAMQDGAAISIELERADMDGGNKQLGGIEDFSLTDTHHLPHLSNGHALLPYADTVKNAIGALAGVNVSYEPLSTFSSANNRIERGILYLTVPIGSNGGGSGSGSVSGSSCGCVNYQFDPTWFTINGSTVTFNEEAINSLVQEVVDEIKVEVQASGILESNAYGTLKVNTSAEQPIDSISVDSTLSY